LQQALFIGSQAGHWAHLHLHARLLFGTGCQHHPMASIYGL